MPTATWHQGRYDKMTHEHIYHLRAGKARQGEILETVRTWGNPLAMDAASDIMRQIEKRYEEMGYSIFYNND